MAERKGFFGRLFGRKPKPEEEAPTDAPEEAEASAAEELAEPELAAEPAEAPVEASADADTAQDAGEEPEPYAPRTEEEEIEDLDAATSTVPEGSEPVAMLADDEDDDQGPSDDHDDISHAMAPEIADEDALHHPVVEEPDEIIEDTLTEEETAAEEPEPVTALEEPDTPPEHIAEALAPEGLPEEEEIAPEPDAELTEEVEEQPAPAAEPDPEPAQEQEPDAQPKKKGLFGRLKEGLAKTSAKLSGGIGGIFTKRKLDDETIEELEDLLITADLGLPATTRIITALSKSKYDQEITDEEVRGILADEVSSTLKPLEAPLEIDAENRPHVILMTGVNGAGKTTTIGKLAKKFSDEGKSVLLAAGDTFRAAAIEQLTVWGERVGVPVVAKETGADAAGLAFDAIKRAQEENIDVVLIDTAGRLQNRKELMEELGKIVRVIKKLNPTAPHDTVLVLDATVGQNALSQAESFLQTAAVSGLIMTKLDGTARGGVLVALGDKFGLPIHYIGVGEAVEDLQAFDADEFAKALTAAGE